MEPYRTATQSRGARQVKLPGPGPAAPPHRQTCTRKGPPGIPAVPTQCRVRSVKRGWRRPVRRLPPTGFCTGKEIMEPHACVPTSPSPSHGCGIPGREEAAGHGSSMTPGESGIRNRLPGQGQCGDRDDAQRASGHFRNALRQPCHHPLRHASRCRYRLQTYICQSAEGNIKVGERLPLATGSECPTPPRPIPRAPRGLRDGRHSGRRKRTVPERYRQPQAGHGCNLPPSRLNFSCCRLPAFQVPTVKIPAGSDQHIAGLHAARVRCRPVWLPRLSGRAGWGADNGSCLAHGLSPGHGRVSV